MKLLILFIALLGLAACNVSTNYLLSDRGVTVEAQYRDNLEPGWVFFGSRGADGILAAFRLATPLDRTGPEESPTDIVFSYRVDGAAKGEFILHRDGELFHDGKWYVVDKDWLYRWQSKYDPRNNRKPNKAPQRNASKTSLSTTKSPVRHG
jgi:hypothetical protein